MKLCQVRKIETSYFKSRYLPLKNKNFHSPVMKISQTISYLRTGTVMLSFFSYWLEQCNSWVCFWLEVVYSAEWWLFSASWGTKVTHVKGDCALTQGLSLHFRGQESQLSKGASEFLLNQLVSWDAFSFHLAYLTLER